MRRGFSTFDLIGSLVVCVWLVFMARLLTSNDHPSAENQLEITASEAAAGFRAGEEWRGLYHRDDKIGFVRLTKTLLDDGYEITLHQVMRLSIMGRDQSVELRVRTAADRDFVLRDFDGVLETSGARFEASGRVEPLPDGRYRIHFELATPESTHADHVDTAEAPLIEHDVARALLERSPAIGDTYAASFFDPMTQLEQSIVVEYDGREPLAVLGQTVQAHHLVHHVGAQSFDRWVNDLGEVLREELPLGLVSVRESRAEAMYGVVRRGAATPATDLVGAARIAAPLAGLDLERAARLTWRIGGVDPLRFELDGGRQTLRLHGGAQVDVRLLREPSDRALRRDELQITRELAAYLTPEPMIQSDDPEIVRQSALIVGDRDGVTAIAEAINVWVHEQLEETPLVSVPSAVDVLVTRRGDCNEHATLATALLRAAGVPARVAVGLAHVEDAFHYHAWVEYWHEGWRTMDPTWGQLPADLGHIRLVSGGLARQVELVELFDSPISIELAAEDRP